MNNPDLDPLHILEIIPLVGASPDRNDLLCCTYVFKALHDMLIQPIWEKIHTGPLSRRPTIEALQQGIPRYLRPKQSPNLIKVHSSTLIKFKSDNSPLQEIWRALLECTHLEHLALSKTHISDDEVYSPFQVCKKRLSLDAGDQWTGGIIQAILSNCPRLKGLVAYKSTVTDIAGGAEWVSTGLTNMFVVLEVDVGQEAPEGMRKQRLAFR
ncbi:hypothetical protein BCR41DRAFT_398875 [Lobosporangium transversale]|uniref:Uncharacterized protein n=1 Tax=Lobosporangium transversale TaxID=64571 RepID=A0A1Y2GGZ9_9FUNG|nr:hypothetical protein BCR41DRAFT_398875 [Lobosporangium transversale]ORZ09437.1 hypothetical protein BCR41DRAFT_398875 [Lobosporangium transversale]|eukprot:XP_021878890.1 hypothetical protein BCR41DRAFT_398875 [Lobosporangium transversale]